MKLEKLLNKLIEKGWKPWGFDGNMVSELKVAFGNNIGEERFVWITLGGYDNIYSINDLCSIESGLWQFVCENKLYDIDYRMFLNGPTPDELNFWLMLSSIQEDKERFILDNIKIDA